MNIRLLVSILILSVTACLDQPGYELTPRLGISENGRFFVTENGDPFFWIGDTGWLLFSKLTREEAAVYFKDRRQKGFNVIQAMVIQDVSNAVNVYGDSALLCRDISRPLVTIGDSPDNPEQYDYWDHVDYLIKLAAENGIYIALVPVWGSNVRNGLVTSEQARKYAGWLAGRYKDQPNVIWVNGGDINGSDSSLIWTTIGSTIRSISPGQLITFHPFGRTQSSKWFHEEDWLDFNMFQSGHRRYDQDTTGLAYGEDNWKYADNDYNRIPVKPTLDGEPSYEGIPQGLHDPHQPYWTDSDVRRYAYWSVFAGCCGFTYGHNAVMQFNKPGDPNPAYGVKNYWEEGLNAPGASQMKYLKQLILSRPFFERLPAREILADKEGTRYDYIAATRGKDYVFVYTFNGRVLNIDMDKIMWDSFKASWFNPRNGNFDEIGIYNNKDRGIIAFDPPGDQKEGNDWILVLDHI